MESDASTRRAIESAVMRLLRPLVRLLLRNAVPFATFEALAKQVYVDVAMQDFALEDKKPSQSRASILTGLTRKEVQRLVASPYEPGTELVDHYNRAARVMTGWIRDPEFVAPGGEPLPLAIDGEAGFAALVKRHSGDMPARAVLDELLRTGAVRWRDDGRLEPVSRAYVPQPGSVEILGILGSDVADLVSTIAHNLDAAPAERRFQRKVMYHAIPVAALPAFRAQTALHAQALLERFDRWLASHDDDAPAQGPDVPRARVGVGIHQFEEPLDPTSAAPGDPR
ncbi:MAG: DUF6502 family protein [Rubrivivax sp.]